MKKEKGVAMDIIRSPFFYVGDKYKLMKQLKKLFPQNIDTYIEPFCGGGSSFLNTKANNCLLNDIDSNVIALHNTISQYSNNAEMLFKVLYDIIDNYNLSCSFKGITTSEDLKKKYPKTYYAKYNKQGYIKLRADYNKNKNDMLKLYILLIYGFNHMIRFNAKGDFNLPVGNVDFNKNVVNALHNYLKFMKQNENYISFYNTDYKGFLNSISIQKNDFVFLDPPYLISMSEYNKLWNEEKEKELCGMLDKLNEDGVRFGITNLINHKGKTNHTFLEWSQKYNRFDINSNYISFNDNTVKENSKEIYVTNVSA